MPEIIWPTIGTEMLTMLPKKFTAADARFPVDDCFFIFICDLELRRCKGRGTYIANDELISRCSLNAEKQILNVNGNGLVKEPSGRVVAGPETAHSLCQRRSIFEN